MFKSPFQTEIMQYYTTFVCEFKEINFISKPSQQVGS